MAHHAARAALLDVLTYELPLDDVSASVWTPLSDEGRRGLRQSSSLGRQLADSLITSASLDMTSAGQPLPWEGQAVGLSAGEGHHLQEPWQQVMTRRCAFLARLPHLTGLVITAESSPALLEALLQSAVPTSGRVRSLGLSSPNLQLSSTAVRLACPRLQHLILGYGVPGEEGCNDSDTELPLKGEGELYFSAFPALRKLEVRASASLTANALRSVSHLTGLRDLSLCVRDELPPDALQDWTRLTHLTRLKLWMADDCALLCPLAGTAPLLRLTQLQHLSLRPVPVHDPADQTAETPAAVAAALALLGGMVNLTALDMGDQFDLDDLALAALDRLTGLTSLGIEAARDVTRPAAGGHLPGLRALSVGYGLRPEQVLHVLQPLLPLPSLTHLASSSDDSLSLLSLDVVIPHDEGVVAEHAAALRHVAQHLAAAPHLHLHTVHVVSEGVAGKRTPMLSLQQVASGLEPLAGSLTHLVFRSKIEMEWTGMVPLWVSLPGLLHLELVCWALSDAELASVVVQLPTLQRLTLSECTEGVTEAGWVGMAAALAHALVLCVEPPLSAEVVAQCRAEGERCHGMCHLTTENE